MIGPTTEAAYTAMVKEQAEAAVGIAIEQIMACFKPKASTDPDLLPEFREALKAKLVQIWTAGHDQAMRDVDAQQKKVLASIKQANDSLEQAVKQRNALRDQLTSLKKRGQR